MNLLKTNFLSKKILYQSKNRGCKETDLILGKFIEKNLSTMHKSDQEDFVKLLQQTDADIYDWVTGKSLPPKELDTSIMRRLISFNFSEK